MSLLIAGFKESEELSRRVASKLGVKYSNIAVKDFPDSEFSMRMKDNPRNKSVAIISSMTKDPDEKIIGAILAAGIAKDYGAKRVILIATYFPYMRQDKHFLKYDSNSSKHIIKLFREFDDIFLLDPHLHRIKNVRKIISKAKKISAVKLIASFIADKYKDNFNIVGPDEESPQWSSAVAKMLGKRVIILQKRRITSRNVKIKEKQLGKRVIIIDDIISTGKTIVETLKMAKRQGAEKITCIGIHGIFAEGADKLIRKYAKLITTNSIPNKYAKIDVSPVIADALKRYL